MRQLPISYKESPDSWQIKVQVKMQKSVEKFIKLLFPFPWLLIAAAIFGIGCAIISIYESGPRVVAAVRMIAINSALIAALANSVVFFENLLDEIADTFPALIVKEKKEAEQWVGEWYDYIFWSCRNVLGGLGLGFVVILVSSYIVPTFFDSLPGQIYAYFLYFCVGFLGGSMLWTMLAIAWMTWSLGKDIKIRSSVFDSNTSALRAVSSMLWKVSLIAALNYVLGTSPIVLCSMKLPPLGIALVVIFGLFVILYFIIPQINIHKTLLHRKQKRLKVLVKQIDKAFDDVAKAPTHKNISQLRELFDIQNVLNGKKSWSFGTKELLMLVGSAVIPLIIFIADCLIKRFDLIKHFANGSTRK